MLEQGDGRGSDLALVEDPGTYDDGESGLVDRHAPEVAERVTAPPGHRVRVQPCREGIEERGGVRVLRRARRRTLAREDDASDEATRDVESPPDGVRGVGNRQAGVEDHRPDTPGEPRGVGLFVDGAVRAADVVDAVVAEGLTHRLDVPRDVARAVAVGIVSEGPAAPTDADRRSSSTLFQPFCTSGQTMAPDPPVPR